MNNSFGIKVFKSFTGIVVSEGVDSFKTSKKSHGLFPKRGALHCKLIPKIESFINLNILASASPIISPIRSFCKRSQPIRALMCLEHRLYRRARMELRACDILKQLYTYCASLNDTVGKLSSECALIRTDDNIDTYIDFCHATVVAAQMVPDGCFTVAQSRSQLEIIHAVIENACKSGSANVLALGYQQLRGNRGLLVAGTKSLESYYPNSIATHVNGQLWQKLLGRIGDDMMMYLLQNCSLYVKLDQGCLLQVTGPPIGTLFTSASIPFTRKPSYHLKTFQLLKKRKRTISKVNEENSIKKHKLDDNEDSNAKRKQSSASNDDKTMAECISSKDVLTQPEAFDVSEVYATAVESLDDTVMNSSEVNVSKKNQPRLWRKRRRYSDTDRMFVISKKKLKMNSDKIIIEKSKIRSTKVNTKKAHQNKRSGDCFIHRSRLFYDQNHKEIFPSSGHLLSHVSASRRGAKKLIADVFKASRLADDWSAFQQSSVYNIHKKVKVSRTPPRLVKLIPLFQTLIANHKITKYRIKLRYYCPLPKGFYDKTSDGKLLDYNTYDKLVGCYTTHNQVGDFIISVIDQVIPDTFWGSKHNRVVFCKHIRKFIKLGRYERFSLKQVMHNIKVSQCKWLRMRKNSWKQVTDSNKQRQLFSQWIMWLMDEFVVKILKGFFYVTESSNHRNRIFYYRKPVWRRIKQLAIKDITRTMLTEVDKEKVKNLVEQKMTVGVAKLRLLPRVGGIRLIENMGSHLNLPFIQATSATKQERSINSTLQNIFHILNYEKVAHPEELGHSAFGANDIYNALLPFAKQIKEEKRTKPLFFISVDISCCYDSIIQSKIYDIINSIIREDEYTIRRYVTVIVSRSRIRRSYKRTATLPGDLVTFPDFANELIASGSLRNAIISDQVVYPFEEKANVLALLRKHIFQNIVKFGAKYYHQTEGIPQGSILSALLCNYYYAAMERQYLPKLDPSESVMIRLVDDFLLVTKSAEVATRFYNIMTRGIPEYNCFINANKTVKNFEISEGREAIISTEDPQWLPWCGYLINTVTVEVRVDYSRYSFTELRDAITMRLYRNPLLHMQQVLINTIHNKCQPLLLSHEINSTETIIMNVYQLFLLTAMKFHTYMKEMHIKRLTQSLVDFQFSTIIKLSHYCYRLSKNVCHEVPTSGISYKSYQWLCLFAYLKTLSKKQSKYLPLLNLISKTVRRVSFVLPSSQKSKLQEIVKGISFNIIF